MNKRDLVALILAGGRGKRLGKFTECVNKCMIKVLNRPLIEYSLDEVSMLEEIKEIIIVVSYKAEDIINQYGNYYKGKRIKYVIQWEPKGVVDAIEWAKDTLAGRDFMLMLGDEFMFNPRHKEMIDRFYKEELFGICGVVKVEDLSLISKTYTVEVDNEGFIKRLVEKPKVPFNNFMGTGNCIFKNEILNYISLTPVNPIRNEKELPDLIGCAVNDGKKIKIFPICEKYVNVNTLSELKEIESYFSH
jgi:NDP-sugar pyrophosphorylase family protein